MRRRRGRGRVDSLIVSLAELAKRLDDASVAEYVEFMRSPRRVAWSNFVAGIARGFGIAIGASVLMAVFLYILSVVIELNVPIIGKLIADIVKFVEHYRS